MGRQPQAARRQRPYGRYPSNSTCISLLESHFHTSSGLRLQPKVSGRVPARLPGPGTLLTFALLRRAVPLGRRAERVIPSDHRHLGIPSMRDDLGHRAAVVSVEPAFNRDKTRRFRIRVSRTSKCSLIKDRSAGKPMHFLTLEAEYATVRQAPTPASRSLIQEKKPDHSDPHIPAKRDTRPDS